MKKYILTQTQIDKLRSNWTLGATLENELDALKPIEPLSVDAVWNSNEIMEINADLCADMTELMRLVRAIERHILGETP